MKTKEEVTNQQIEGYIEKLVRTYGFHPPVNETALKIEFDHHLYAECVLEIMRKMGLPNKVKVTCYSDAKYPDPTSAARIQLSLPMPRFGSQKFNSMKVPVEIKESVKNNFHGFVTAITHELSHVVMHSTNHELQNSEIATDLCAVVFGFSSYMIKGKRIITNKKILTAHGVATQYLEIGYLSLEQLTYAAVYIEKLRQRPAQPIRQSTQEKKKSPDGLLSKIKRTLQSLLTK